jgi:N-methylhydantoinase B
MDMAYDFFRVVDYSLRPGSGGAGEYRGGLGFQRIYEVLCDDVTFATYGDRFALQPQGLFGGEPGMVAEALVIRGEERIALRSKQSFKLRKGDRLVMRTGGGAGYGAPADRDSTRVHIDLEDGR